MTIEPLLDVYYFNYDNQCYFLHFNFSLYLKLNRDPKAELL